MCKAQVELLALLMCSDVIHTLSQDDPKQTVKETFLYDYGLISLTILPGMLSPKKQLFIFKEIVKEKLI